MTVRRGTVTREPTPEPRAAAAIAELKTLIGGQQEATGDLRERVKGLESESKHYATKADLANVKVWAMSGVIAALLSLLVAWASRSSARPSVPDVASGITSWTTGG